MKRDLESKQTRDNYDAIHAKLFVTSALANSVLSGATNTNDTESMFSTKKEQRECIEILKHEGIIDNDSVREIRELRAKLDNCRDALKFTLDNCANLPDSVVTKIMMAVAQSY